MTGGQTSRQQVGKRNTLKVEQQPGILLLMTPQHSATLVTIYHLTGKKNSYLCVYAHLYLLIKKQCLTLNNLNYKSHC